MTVIAVQCIEKENIYIKKEIENCLSKISRPYLYQGGMSSLPDVFGTTNDAYLKVLKRLNIKSID